jgi:hypothetical protein
MRKQTAGEQMSQPHRASPSPSQVQVKGLGLQSFGFVVA